MIHCYFPIVEAVVNVSRECSELTAELWLGELFGLLPVCGVLNKNGSDQERREGRCQFVQGRRIRCQDMTDFGLRSTVRALVGAHTTSLHHQKAFPGLIPLVWEY